MRKTVTLLAASLCLVMPQIAAAQQIGPVPTQQLPSDVRITAGITIPLGGNGQRADEEPRLDLNIAPETSAFALSGGTPLPVFERHDFQRSFKPKPLLSFNLGPSQRVSIAGQTFYQSRFYQNEGDPESEEKDKDSTIEKIGKGAAIAALAAGVVVAGGLLAIVIACSSEDGCGE
ncbi:MAG: hypothetical protein AAFX04_08710 [Pseudomonadota bacterium]